MRQANNGLIIRDVSPPGANSALLAFHYEQIPHNEAHTLTSECSTSSSAHLSEEARVHLNREPAAVVAVFLLARAVHVDKGHAGGTQQVNFAKALR